MRYDKTSLTVDTSGNPIIYQATRATAVTPSNTTVLEAGTLFIGSGGNVEVVLVGDSTPIVFNNVADGTFLPMLVKMVYTTNTTASNILILR